MIVARLGWKAMSLPPTLTMMTSPSASWSRSTSSCGSSTPPARRASVDSSMAALTQPKGRPRAASSVLAACATSSGSSAAPPPKRSARSSPLQAGVRFVFLSQNLLSSELSPASQMSGRRCVAPPAPPAPRIAAAKSRSALDSWPV